MTEITPIALTVVGDEKAIGLVETNLQSPNNKGFHRYQIIYVIRDGKTAEFRRDLGAESDWKGVNLINIPSLLEHSVDELIDMAEQIRNDKQVDVKDLLGLEKYNPA